MLTTRQAETLYGRKIAPSRLTLFATSHRAEFYLPCFGIWLSTDCFTELRFTSDGIELVQRALTVDID